MHYIADHLLRFIFLHVAGDFQGAGCSFFTLFDPYLCNNWRHKVTAFHISFHACADYANENLLESCCTQIFPMLALYTHVHAVHMLPSFHVPTHVLKKVGEGKRHTRRRERESMLCLDVRCGTILFVLVYYSDTIT
jgi:hypothetical protein